MKATVAYLLALISLLLAPSLWAAEWVPPGFESLNEPQVTLVDVNYGGYVLTTALVRFTQEELRFLEPAALVAELPDLLDPAAVEQLLDRDFPTNAASICRSGFQLDCGVLTPEGIEIIFDRDRLALSLFLAPDLLQVRAPQDMRYLPDSDAPISMYSSNALYFSGSTNTEYSYNLYTNSQLAWKENHFVGRASITEDALLVDQLSLGRNYRGQQFDLGLFRGNAESFGFLNTEQFLGAGMQSSLLSLQGAEQYQGTRIELFLPTRSRVELHSEGRLLSTRFYEAGNQVIDTMALPGGAYELEIRIIDAAGATRVEYQYFSKTSRLPPADAAQYFVQFGQLQQTGVPFDELSGSTLMLRGGFNRRIGEVTGVRSGFAATRDHWMLETGLSRVGADWEMHGGLALDDTGARGEEFSLYWRPTLLQLGVNYRSINAGTPDSLLRNSQQQLQLSLELPTVLGNFSLFSRKLSSGLTPTVIASNGFRWRSNGWRDGSGMANTSLELSRNSGETLVMLNFSWRLGTDTRSLMVAPQFYQDANGSDMRGVAESRWQARDESKTTVALRAARQGRDSVEANLSREGRQLGSDLTARYDVETSDTSFFGRLSNSVALHPGGVALSGAQAAESAFAISVDGDLEDAVFEVLVDGSPRGIVHSGKRTLVHLPPFKSYRVELMPVGERIINLDEGSKQRVLYPGNVVGLHWTASSIVIGYGRLVDTHGQPVAEALVENTSGLVVTDANGYFQAELDTNVDQLRVRKQGMTCQVALPPLDPDSLLMALGTLRCLPVTQ